MYDVTARRIARKDLETKFDTKMYTLDEVAERVGKTVCTLMYRIYNSKDSLPIQQHSYKRGMYRFYDKFVIEFYGGTILEDIKEIMQPELDRINLALEKVLAYRETIKDCNKQCAKLLTKKLNAEYNLDKTRASIRHLKKIGVF